MAGVAAGLQVPAQALEPQHSSALFQATIAAASHRPQTRPQGSADGPYLQVWSLPMGCRVTPLRATGMGASAAASIRRPDPSQTTAADATPTKTTRTLPDITKPPVK